MQRQSSYTYPQYTAPPSHKQYPAAHSTSSAFSASANPNEDWTKISDLAERRRIQNRIAQRNYRKKLKKRLEDLERRAGSSSASPEQRHEELATEGSPSDQSSSTGSQRHRSNDIPTRRERTPEVFAQQYVLPSDDRSMFSQQFTRQLSTSPPPFSYASMPPTENGSYATYPGAASYCGLPEHGSDMALYPQYAHSLPYGVQTINSPPIKREYYGDDEISPFSMSYASINEMPSFQDMPPYVSTRHHPPPYTPQYPRPGQGFPTQRS